MVLDFFTLHPEAEPKTKRARYEHGSEGQSSKDGVGKEGGSNSEPTVQGFTGLIWLRIVEAALPAKVNDGAGKSNTSLQQEKGPSLKERLRGIYQLAMDFYNTTNGVEFEDVVPLSCNYILAAGYYYHFNFKAKPKNADSSADLSEKVFFGEVRYFMGVFTVIACCIVDPKTDADICHGCGILRSPEKVYHPVSGFKAGRCDWIKTPPLSYTEQFEQFNPSSIFDRYTHHLWI